MAGLLRGKVALVNGGGSGIGRATALRLAQEGAKVMIVDFAPEAAERSVKLIKDVGGEASCIAADVVETRQVAMMVKRTVETYGRLDCAYNNAGIEGVVGDTISCTEENFDRVLASDLKSVWLCMKHEIIQMLKQGGGSIVNNASIAGLFGLSYLPAYVAAKHGVVGLTKTAALEYAQKNIRVNCVCPGVICTQMVEHEIEGNGFAEAEVMAAEPIGRLGQPKEIAEGVLWLLSDASSFVTGHPLTIDGGFAAR
jgi:NAD(P)-dependent dehydrogenase (short-subunit alcohol dehydrogenase family)